MKYSYLDNLRFIAEYIVFDDAPALLGVSLKTLTNWVTGKSVPSKKNQLLIEAVADRLDAEQLTASVKSALEIMGKGHLEIPPRMPPILRTHETGKLNSPVYIYDFRGMTANEVMKFFRFMKTVAPNGYFFLTYELTHNGLADTKDGMFFSNELVDELKAIHGERSPIAAIRAELGTAGSDAKIDKLPDGYMVYGMHAVSTVWMPFCVLSGPGTCEIRTDFEFFEIWNEYNNISARRQVIECGISYPRPIELTDEEKAEDVARGADPLTGLVYIWQD